MEKTYTKPAVKEAIFEIKFSEDNYDEATPGQFFEQIKDEFPNKNKIEIIQFSLGGNVDRNEPQVPVMQAWRKDESALLQVGPGIVIANSITYENWKTFTPIIRKALKSYTALTQPTDIKRLSTRYINFFDLPTGRFNLMDYFNLGIQLPTEMENVEAFNFSFYHELDSFKVKTKFSTAQEGANQFILDINCFSESETDVSISNIIKLGTQAHDTVKKVFESFITNKTRSLMEEK